jgi:electron transport complex protein RnfC
MVATNGSERTPLDYRSLPPERVREALRDAGVVGLGGAVFPSHAKLTAARSVAVEQLVINGAECEPFMTCDDLLMRERAEESCAEARSFASCWRPGEC